MGRVVALTAVRDWINAQTTTLVGPGNPIPHGAHRKHLRSPGQGAYVLLSRVGGTDDLIAEESADRARISASIFAGTDEAAEIAAVSYANAISGLSGQHVEMGSALCLVADNITGPLLVDLHLSDQDEFRYLVDADFFLINSGGS